MVYPIIILFFKATDKTLHLLNVERVGQLNTLLAVIWHYGKGSLSSSTGLLLGFVGLSLVLAAIGLGSNFPFVALSFGVSAIVALNLHQIMFRGRRYSQISPLQDPLSCQLLFWKLGYQYRNQIWDGHCQTWIGNIFWIDLSLSNHCNSIGHDEVLDAEVGRNEIVREC